MDLTAAFLSGYMVTLGVLAAVATVIVAGPTLLFFTGTFGRYVVAFWRVMARRLRGEPS